MYIDCELSTFKAFQFKNQEILQQILPMNKLYITLSLMFICVAMSLGQSKDKTITTRKVFGGYQFYQGAQRLNMSQLVRAVEPNAEAHKLAKSAKSNIVFSSIIGGVGGFMLGWNLGTAIGGGEPNWYVAGAGAGLILVSIPISNKGMRQAKSAVQLHNDSSGYGFEREAFRMYFMIAEGGPGLGIRF